MRKLLVFCLLILTIFLAALTYTVEGQQRNITFNTNDNSISYASSLNAFRQAVRTDRKAFDIFLLPRIRDISESNRFKKISITDSRITVKLAMDATNVYVLGYYTPNPTCKGAYFFNDSVARLAKNYVFKYPGQPQNDLPFDGSYTQLARYGGSRTSLNLGLPTLGRLLPALYNCRQPKETYESVAQALVVAIQIVSESARYKIVQDHVERNIPPTLQVLDLQNNWSLLSKAVQDADPRTKRFKTNVTLIDQTGAPVVVYSVEDHLIIRNLKLLLNMQLNARATSAALPGLDMNSMPATI